VTHIAVVFESMFGNTERLARAIAAGLAGQGSVDILRAAPDVVLDEDVDLVVVGGPTHAFSLSRASTRTSAGQQGAVAQIAGGPGLREWIEGLPARGPVSPAVAAFDTRIKKRGVPGSAARAAEKRLRRLGLPVLTPAMSFWVDGTTGPLVAGEAERARQWGALLAQLLRERQGVAG
jgi:hypothetical protein